MFQLYSYDFRKIFSFALLALSLRFSLGIFRSFKFRSWSIFALGGYSLAMYLMRQIGDRGVYGNPELPDFMVFMNLKELPWFWYGLIIHCLLFYGDVCSCTFWLFCILDGLHLNQRVTGVYLSIITQALTYALMLAFLEMIWVLVETMVLQILKIF